MRLLYFILITLSFLVRIPPMRVSAADTLTWSHASALPDRQGFAGPFVGTHQEVLLVAGGANFPDKMPWQGGTKTWYDTVFLLDKPGGIWKEVGKLPRQLGYGVSISTNQGLVCIGGSDAQRHYADCFILRWEHSLLKTLPLPSLPKPCANFCGAIIEGTIYVAGGIETPTATATMNAFWSLDLGTENAIWIERESWPGPPRMLAVAAVQDGAFFLCSGTDLNASADGKPVREYLRDAYCYRPDRGWKRIADLPRPAVAAPTPAPTFDPSSFLVMGGDDGSLVDFQPPEAHPGFPRSILAYHTHTDAWQIIGDMPAGQVTTSMAPWKDRFVMASGEVRPGVRSPAVWLVDLARN